MMNIDALGTAIANATMKAAAEMLRAQGKGSKDIDLDKLTEALRSEAKAAAGRILDQGKALLDGGMSGWLNTLMTVECCQAAKNALETLNR